MNKKLFQSKVDSLPVYDTHTHLKGSALCAQNFWDIGHYFWFIRELQAAGYPEDPTALRPAQRVRAFWAAYQQIQNTSMSWVVRRILADLYGLELQTESDIMKADEAIRSSATDPGWAATVCDRTNIQKIVTNVPADVPFEGIPQIGRVVPRLERHLRGWIYQIENAGDQHAELVMLSSDIRSTTDELSASGYPGIMTSNDPFGRLALHTHLPARLSRSGNSRDQIGVALLHELCQACSESGLFIQFFLGIEKGYGSEGGGGGIPSFDPDRILNRHGLFKKYPIEFELVLGDGIGNPDAVNAARIFPNVRVGGMWWYNFRASTYLQTMQQRFEALPASRSSLVVSDARCIEWCYGKIVLIKRLLSDFLMEQVDGNWIDEPGAIQIAKYWLHDSAETIYE